MRVGLLLVCMVTVTLAEMRPVAAEPQPGRPSTSNSTPRLLDVPFVPQSEALCGGAAVAMVLRYWKSSAVYAEDFASLVQENAEGIKLADLARAVHERGWRAVPFAGTSEEVRRQLSAGRPVIALIEARPGRYHYVVVVAWAGGRTVFHDPAHGPFRAIDEQKFTRDWTATGRTTLLVVPSEDRVEALDLAERDEKDSTPHGCQQSIDQAVEHARGGDLESAEALLSVTSTACPDFSGGPRELAGIRFLQKRWSDASVLAAQAVERDASDLHAWQLLASARFLAGDPAGALAAWNHRYEPRIDLVRVEGLRRMQYDVISSVLDLPPRALLTESDLRRASRRVAALPAVVMSRVSYSPASSGLANVDVAVVERPLVPSTWSALGVASVQAAVSREARIDIGSPTGNAELWTMTGRWWAHRPRVSVALATPQLWRWRGLWRVEGAWERQTYSRFESERRHASLTFADWRSGNVRWELSGALDHWNERGNQPSAGVAVERRFDDHQLALRVQGAVWLGHGGAKSFTSASMSSEWRPTTEGPAFWTSQMGVQFVSAAAPFDLWPAGDTGLARAPLLRAHPLLADGVIRTSDLGRILLHGTLERQRRLATHPLGELRLAAFVDVAKLVKRAEAISTPLHVDIGAGLRVQIPGAPGLLRLDLARGMRDGRVAFSAGWSLVGGQ